MTKLFNKLFLFQVYSYCLNIFYKFSEIIPPPFRIFLLRIFFKKIGKNCLIDYEVYFRFPELISLGKNVIINRGCEFYASHLKGGANIIIGDNVVFSPYVILFSAQQDYSTLALDDKVQSIIIEDNVWIGGRVTILPGVKIGKGSVIGAGSVVTKDTPPFTVSVGVPAKVIKKREILN